jgi:predicted dehydrogenase
MAYDHAAAYQALPDACTLVACADIVHENAEAFAHATGLPAEGVFTDYRAMLAEAHLDVVSICTWPHLHAPMAIDCARAGVRAVHCEKPMADAWGAARLMAQECARRGVQLTFNHQRRFGAPFRAARDLLESGAIGDLVRVEVSCDNVYDWGTHYLDMCGFYTGDQPAEWVIGQIDYRTEQRIFGAHVENHAVGSWRYRSGVFGLIATGSVAGLIGVDNRLIGSQGVIEVGVPNGADLARPARGAQGVGDHRHRGRDLAWAGLLCAGHRRCDRCPGVWA